MSKNSSPARISAVERRAQTVELRTQGHTFEEIAKIVGYSNKASAYKAFQTALESIVKEPVETYRAVELQRLDKMTQGLADRAFDGDIPAVHALLKVMERRAKMLGLDHSPDLSLTNNGQIQVVLDDRVMDKKRSAVEMEIEPETP